MAVEVKPAVGSRFGAAFKYSNSSVCHYQNEAFRSSLKQLVFTHGTHEAQKRKL